MAVFTTEVVTTKVIKVLKGEQMQQNQKPASGLARREALAAYAFITPWIIGFLVFTIGPMLASLKPLGFRPS